MLDQPAEGGGFEFGGLVVGGMGACSFSRCSLRTALVAFLVARFSAEPQPVDSGAYEYPLKIGGHIVNVAHSGDFGTVLVSLQERGTDTTLVPDIARQFDEALATGRYDSMFGP